jgi:type I restriction enzyme, S subunit
MSEWVQLKLEECADILDHLRVPVNEEERSRNPGKTPYYGANGLQGTIQGWIFNEPLILMAEDGGYFDEFDKRPIAYKINGKSWVNNHAHIIRPKEGYDFDFIFYTLEHKNVLPFIKGGTRAKLNQRELRCIKIYSPKKRKIQRKISQILCSIDQTIAQTEALIQKYQQIKAGLMHDLFTRGITPDGKLRPPREQAPELYRETAIGWIPREWDCVPIDSLIESLADGPFGSNLKTEHYVIDPGVRVVRLQNIQATSYNDSDKAFISEKHANYLSRNKVLAGDILIAGLGEERYPVGRACQYPQELPPAINKADCFRMRGDTEKVDNYFLMLYLNTSKARNQTRRYEQGVTRPRINTSNMKKIYAPRPRINEQKAISTKLLELSEKIENEFLIKDKLNKQKSGLMHDLLTGKVPVTLSES